MPTNSEVQHGVGLDPRQQLAKERHLIGGAGGGNRRLHHTRPLGRAERGLQARQERVLIFHAPTERHRVACRKHDALPGFRRPFDVAIPLRIGSYGDVPLDRDVATLDVGLQPNLAVGIAIVDVEHERGVRRQKGPEQQLRDEKPDERADADGGEAESPHAER